MTDPVEELDLIADLESDVSALQCGSIDETIDLPRKIELLKQIDTNVQKLQLKYLVQAHNAKLAK